MSSTSRYHVRFKSRPILFWWQAVTLLMLFILLIGMLMLTVIRQPAMVAIPLPEPTAMYVTLAPDYAAQLFKRSLVAWMTGRSTKQNIPDLDLRALDFNSGLGAPDFLEQRTAFSDNHQPLEITTLPIPFAEISIASASPAPTTPAPPQEGLFIETSPALVTAEFTFPTHELEATHEGSGGCRFYVETDTEGRVIHVLLRSRHSPETVPIERALMRGRAQGAVSGTVDIRWSYTK